MEGVSHGGGLVDLLAYHSEGVRREPLEQRPKQLVALLPYRTCGKFMAFIRMTSGSVCDGTCPPG